MLFPGEELSGKVLMILLLAISSILAIVINVADLSGDRKYRLFKSLHSINLFLFMPACIYIMVIQVWGLVDTNYITIENSMWRIANFIGAFLVFLVCITRIQPFTAQGIAQTRKKSANSSKYQQLFQKLRTSYISMIVFLIFSYWLTFMFGGD